MILCVPNACPVISIVLLAHWIIRIYYIFLFHNFQLNDEKKPWNSKRTQNEKRLPVMFCRDAIVRGEVYFNWRDMFNKRCPKDRKTLKLFKLKISSLRILKSQDKEETVVISYFDAIFASSDRVFIGSYFSINDLKLLRCQF